MITLTTNLPNWRGCKDATLVRLPKDHRTVVAGKRLNYRYGVKATILGKQYLFPSDKQGRTKHVGTEYAKPIELVSQ